MRARPVGIPHRTPTHDDLDRLWAVTLGDSYIPREGEALHWQRGFAAVKPADVLWLIQTVRAQLPRQDALPLEV